MFDQIDTNNLKKTNKKKERVLIKRLIKTRSTIIFGDF